MTMSVSSKSMGPSWCVQILRASELPSAVRTEKPACERIALHNFVIDGSSSTTRIVGGKDWGAACCCSDIELLPNDSILPGKVYGQKIHIIAHSEQWACRN
jgi:hypothetical protein